MERFLTFDRLISFHRNRLDIPDFPWDKLNMAYLDNKYEQFMIHLTKEYLDLNMVKKVIKEIYNQLQCGDEVFNYAIKHPELLDAIYNYMQNFKTEDSDEYKKDYEDIRVLASMCFRQFCMVLVVKEQLNIDKYIETIHNSFQDESEDVRINVYLGLIYYSKSRYGIDTLLSNKILNQIIEKIVEEKKLEVLNLILILSNEILAAETAPLIALECDIIPKLKIHIDTTDYNVLENVLLNYGSVSLCEEGKKKCADEGSLIKNIILKLDKYKGVNKQVEAVDLKILIACTRFLMSTSILKRGKVEIFENNGIELLFQILLGKFSNDVQLILNILQTISNVSEEPRGRKLLLTAYLPHVEKLISHEYGLISEQAVIAKNIITWEP